MLNDRQSSIFISTERTLDAVWKRESRESVLSAWHDEISLKNICIGKEYVQPFDCMKNYLD